MSSEKPKPESSEYAGNLRAQALKKVDVTTYARQYGLTETQAAEALIERGFNGRDIAEERGKNNYKSARSDAAAYVFEQEFGSGKPRQLSKPQRYPGMR